MWRVVSVILTACVCICSSSNVGRLLGPLPMHPAAEDNYGYDACSVLCLSCIPNILVIATESGLLYHCVVLEGEDDDEQTVSNTSLNFFILFVTYFCSDNELPIKLNWITCLLYRVQWKQWALDVMAVGSPKFVLKIALTLYKYIMKQIGFNNPV